MGSKAVRWTVVAVAGIALFEVALQWVWPYLDDNDPVPDLERQMAVLAALSLLALPHAIAVRAYRGRPALLKVAGTVALVLGVVSLLPVTLAIVGIPLLLVPSFYYFDAARGSGPGGRVPTPALALVATACALAAAGAFFFTEDPRCERSTQQPEGDAYTFEILCESPQGAGVLGVRDISRSGTSDVITFRESVPSLALSLGALGFCVWGSAGTRPRHTTA